MTPTEIKRVLAEIGGGSNKRLGQHFLVDPKTLDVIVETADIHHGDVVLEVGPGLGVLTDALEAKGADVIAIERDRRFIDRLSHGSARVVHGDAADIHWHELVGDREWKFVSNLPYAISSLALRKALWSPRPPETVVVLVQREVGERIIAKNGKTSLLSLMVSLTSESSRIVRRVAPGAFFPPPKVESVVLQITPIPWIERTAKWGIEPEKIMQVAKKGFAHPRKLLTSNLGIKKIGIDGIAEKTRAEDVTPEQWAKIAITLSA